MDNQFVWVDFYKEFAYKLLEFKDNRTALIQIVRQMYQNTGIGMPTLEKDNNIIDIDPFTVFGTFNKSSLKEENRIKIIRAYAELLDIKASVPTSFNSIPTVMNQNATFYYFVGDRSDADIPNLWGLFENALKYAENPSVNNRQEVSKYFDLVINTKGNANSKVTIGLYWISPEVYFNLDSRCIWYVYESGKIPAEVTATLPKIESNRIAAEKYFTIVERLREYLKSGQSKLTNFKELSFEAWRYSEEVNQLQKKDKTRDQKGSALADDDVPVIHYWMYTVFTDESWEDNQKKGQMVIGLNEIGDYTQYETKEDIRQALIAAYNESSHTNQALMAWNFAHVIKPGDVVFAKRSNTLVGKGIVTGEYSFDESVGDYKNSRSVDWQVTGTWEHPGNAVAKRLTDITAYTDYVDKLLAIFASSGDDLDEDQAEIDYPDYSVEQFLDEVYMDQEDYDTLVELLRVKKNVILQGAPGVGKTFAAKRLAYSMIGKKNQERVQLIQFHLSYTYEDFIEGFRPSSTNAGFEIKKGSFYNFCKKAADDLENEYFFIIDEINRGNLSKIFGELFMLIENDKRGNALQLLYSDEKFFVPANVYIIGMMNTADRSLAMLDYALRRRFAFFEMNPGFTSDGFREYRMQLGSGKFDSLIDCVEKLNGIISSDDSLGEGFCIGHSYFCNLEAVTDKTLSNIVEYEMVPLLKEYWYDEPIKVKDWTDKLRSSIK